MAGRKQLLQGSAAGAAREVTGRQIAIWLAAHRRMTRRYTTRALHDFRVSLRRLRTTVRALERFLRIPKTFRRDLRGLTRATNDSRNLGVWQRWVDRQTKLLTRRQRIGAGWLRERIRQDKRQADRRMRREISEQLPRLRGTLVALRSEPAGHRKGSYPTGAAAVRRAVREETDELRQLLARVRSMHDRDAAHAARIAIKRLRYLIEPFAGELHGSGKLLDRLERMQDILGEIHDAHVFADALRDALADAGKRHLYHAGRELLPWPGEGRILGESPPAGARVGLVALARRLEAEGEERFDQLRKQRKKGMTRALLSGLRVLGRGKGQNRGGRI